MALVEQQLSIEKEIRKQQAQEYERRLAELNHAHAEALRVQSTYVDEELYNRDHRETVGRLDKLERANSEQQGRYAVIALGLTMGLAVLTIAVNVFLKFATF
jgi:hypothetical protein